MRLLLGLLVVSLIELLAPQPVAAATQQVMIMGYAYSAATVTARPGDTITWTNHDDAPHDVVTSGGPAAFHSPLLEKGQSWTTTVTAAGTYSYYCSVHPDMRAQIVVLAQDSPTQLPLRPPAPTTTTPARQQPVVQQPAVTTTTTPPPPTTSTITTAGPEQPQTTAAAAVIGERLDPMLLVAGIVAAVAVLCLLLLSARPDT